MNRNLRTTVLRLMPSTKAIRLCVIAEAYSLNTFSFRSGRCRPYVARQVWVEKYRPHCLQRYRATGCAFHFVMKQPLRIQNRVGASCGDAHSRVRAPLRVA
jgi:hypothetical protein